MGNSCCLFENGPKEETSGARWWVTSSHVAVVVNDDHRCISICYVLHYMLLLLLCFRSSMLQHIMLYMDPVLVFGGKVMLDKIPMYDIHLNHNENYEV